MRIEELEAEVLKLDLDARARLARKLIESLDELSDAERERLWLDEAERRQREIEAGQVELRPGEDVLRRARSELV